MISWGIHAYEMWVTIIIIILFLFFLDESLVNFVTFDLMNYIVIHYIMLNCVLVVVLIFLSHFLVLFDELV